MAQFGSRNRVDAQVCGFERPAGFVGGSSSADFSESRSLVLPTRIEDLGNINEALDAFNFSDSWVM